MEIEAVAELEVDVEKIGPQGYSAYEVYVQNGGTLTEIEWLASLEGKNGKDGTNGEDGITPTIGENGDWYIGETDTGKPSRGEKGDNGVTPMIGENGNWFIGSTDTGLPSQGKDNSSIVTILASDDDETIMNKLSSIKQKNRKVDKALFYIGNGNNGADLGGVYSLYQYYTDVTGNTIFLFIGVFNDICFVEFTISDGNLIKTVGTISFQEYSGVKLITGNLEDLNTEDKSNLVNAINELNNDIDNLDGAVFERLVETDVTGEIEIGTIIDTRKGVEDTRFPNSRCTGFIDVFDGADYYYTGRIYNYIGIAGYDSNGKFVASVLSDTTERYTDYKLTIPDGVAKIRASSYSTNNEINPLKIIEKKYKGLKDDIADLGYIVKSIKSNSDKINANITTVNHIYVATIGSDETGDGSYNKPFATIYHANESITDASEKNQYIIHVADGVYTDLQTRYAGIQSHANYEGVICKPWVVYEGNVKHPENVVIQWDGKTGYDSDFSYNSHGIHFCPFHITQMNTIPSKKYTAIRGFTFDCKNLRYALHIEMSGYGYMTNWEVTDCRFIWHGTPDCTDKPDPTPTIGTGSGFYENGLIARCKIINDSGVTHGFRNHDNDWKYSSSLGDVPKIGANIIIEDCIFGDTLVMFRSIKGDNTVDGFNRFSIINCSGISTLTYALSGGATKCNWRAEVKASEITSDTFAKESLLQ